MKGLLWTVAALLLSANVMAKGNGDNGGGGEQVMKWNFQTSESSPNEGAYVVKNRWAAKIAEKTNGKIQITIHPNGAIVPPTQVYDAISSGILQGGMNDPGYFSGKNPVFAMLGNLVGAWSDPHDFLDFMRYGGGEKLYNKASEPYGVHLIAASTTGLEAFVSTKPLPNLAALKGLKIRTPEGMVSEVFRRAGAAPVVLASSETFTSLQKGVVDAADVSVFSNNYNQGYYDVAPYALYPGWHSLPMVDVSISKKIWDSLPPETQKMLEDSVREMSEDMIQELQKRDAIALEKARKNPKIKIIDWSKEDRKAFRTIAAGVWKDWAKKNDDTREVYQAAMSFMKERGLLD